jgi:hypothetical protein
MVTSEYAKALDRCHKFGDVFTLVKKAVRASLGKERGGLMLYLADLPLHIGAFHGVGSNAIVMNRRLLNYVVKSARSMRQVNSYVFSILLHEYIHSLGCLDEHMTRRLVYEVTKRTLGEEHEATAVAAGSPIRIFPATEAQSDYFGSHESPEVITDFDRPNQTYIS